MSKKNGSNQVVALDDVSVNFPDRGLIFLLGKSGSGKSTLLNCIGGLDKFNSGEIIIKGKSSKNFKQSDFDSYRNTYIGFIFQEYNILEEFSVGKNLALALELQGKRADKRAVESLLEQVDLKGFYKRKPNQLSGGQKQRVAIARALIKDPEIIMADEPTGALDSGTGIQVMDTLKKLSQTKLVIVVTHDREFAEIYGDRVIELKDGKIIRDDTKTEVEPEKSSSGISFIDDKIIHIQKGQKITKQDLVEINQHILKNTEQDTIISFEAKTNNEIKKTAFITEQGNRQVFLNTQPQDIKSKNYTPNDFKSIKSRMKLGDSIKMGASSLKHKPIKLFFTILLSMVAFAMFGVSVTMATYNRASSVYESVKTLKVETISVSKSEKGEYQNTTIGMTKDDITKLAENTDEKFFPVIFCGSSYGVGVPNHSPEYYPTLTSKVASGFVALTDELKSTLKLELKSGNYPANANEVCVSERIESIGSPDGSIIGKKFYFEKSTTELTVVGVVRDSTDLSRYESNTNTNSIMDYMKQSELQTILKYGTVGMVYGTQQMFDEFSASYILDIQLNYPRSADGGCYGFDPSNEIKSCKKLTTTPSFIQAGIDFQNLSGNQAIVPLRTYYQLGLSETEFKQAIENGNYQIKFFKQTDYEQSNPFIVLDVVGYDIYDYNIYTSPEFIVKNFGGYDYAVSRFDSDSKLKSAIKYIENFKDGDFIYSTQFASTPILDSFSSTLNSMTKILMYVSIGFAVFSGFMLMNFIATSISYKKREIGVLRAIGARGKDVFKIFFIESLIICLINFVLSAVACGVVCHFINRAIIKDLGFNVTLLSFGGFQMLCMLGVTMLVAFVSTFLPVFKIARKNPIDSINNR